MLNREKSADYTFIRVTCAGSCFCNHASASCPGWKVSFFLRTADGVETHDGVQPLTLRLDDDSFMCHDMQRHGTTCKWRAHAEYTSY